MSEDQTPKRWRTYHIHGKGYAEVFGPCAPGSDRIAVTSQEDADMIAAAPEMKAAIEGAMRIVNLWQPSEDTPEDHWEEAKAVYLMKSAFEDVLRKVSR